MMDRTTDGLEGVFAYMDDSRVGSLDRQIHLCHLEAFFTALAANGLAINLENVFLQHLLLRFLDTEFRRQERPLRPIMPPKSKIARPPRTSSNLQRFLGMVNFYCHFLPKCAQILKPLTDFLKDCLRTGGIPKC